MVRLSKKLLFVALAGALLLTNGMMSGETVFARATEAIKGDLAAMFGFSNIAAPSNDSTAQAPTEQPADMNRTNINTQTESANDPNSYSLNTLYHIPVGQDAVVQALTHKRIAIPKSMNGSLTPVTRLVHDDQFFMAESIATNGHSKASINIYQLDRVKNIVTLLSSQPILDIPEGTAYSFTYNEADQQLTVSLYNDAKRSAVSSYQFVDDTFVKKDK